MPDKLLIEIEQLSIFHMKIYYLVELIDFSCKNSATNALIFRLKFECKAVDPSNIVMRDKATSLRLSLPFVIGSKRYDFWK